jgi:hypothetical protein
MLLGSVFQLLWKWLPWPAAGQHCIINGQSWPGCGVSGEECNHLSMQGRGGTTRRLLGLLLIPAAALHTKAHGWEGCWRVVCVARSCAASLLHAPVQGVNSTRAQAGCAATKSSRRCRERVQQAPPAADCMGRHTGACYEDEVYCSTGAAGWPAEAYSTGAQQQASVCILQQGYTAVVASAHAHAGVWGGPWLSAIMGRLPGTSHITWWVVVTGATHVSAVGCCLMHGRDA